MTEDEARAAYYNDPTVAYLRSLSVETRMWLMGMVPVQIDQGWEDSIQSTKPDGSHAGIYDLWAEA